MSLLRLSAVTVVLYALLAIIHQRLAEAQALRTDAVLYYVVLTSLIACYWAVIRSAHEALDRRSWRMLVGVPIVVQLGWLISLPVLSIDAYSYLVDAAHAYAGLNPYLHPVKEAAATDLGRTLSLYDWRPVHGVTPYGPVWLLIVTVAGPYASHVEVGVRILKVLAFAATAGTAWLVFRTAPESFRVRACTAFWWNPAIIIEGAGEGHNDIVMTLAVVFSLWWLWRRAVIPAAGAWTAAVLIKWVPALFAPACFVYAWRTGLLNRRTVTLAAAVTVAIAVVTYWPFWAGANTFDGLRSMGAPRFVASTTGSFGRVLGPYPTAMLLLRVAASTTLAAIVMYGAVRTRTIEDVFRACAVSALGYILLASPAYWAWYVTLPIALLTLAGDLPLVLVLTITSRLVAPFDLLRLHGGFSRDTEVWLTTVIGLWLPLALIGACVVLRRHAGTRCPFIAVTGWLRGSATTT